MKFNAVHINVGTTGVRVPAALDALHKLRSELQAKIRAGEEAKRELEDVERLLAYARENL